MKRTNRSGRRYHVWSENEEQALKRGVRLYGVGAWEVIRQDEAFAILKHRSGVQLKDKWRNLVKFRKVDGNELKNLPKRLSGPWSKKSQILRLFNEGIVSVHDRDGCHDGSRRKTHRLEDRRFGIYDFRRYVKKQNYHRRSCSSEMSDSTTSIMEIPYTVACICGVEFDDGEKMIECEKCKEWAHTACLEAQENKPLQLTDKQHYVCYKCRNKMVLVKHEDSSSVSDFDVCYPLQLRFQSKGQRLHRKRRSEFESLCRMMRSFQKSKLFSSNHNFKINSHTLFGFTGGLSVTTAAYILTEQLKKTIQSDCSHTDTATTIPSVSYYS